MIQWPSQRRERYAMCAAAPGRWVSSKGWAGSCCPPKNAWSVPEPVTGWRMKTATGTLLEGKGIRKEAPKRNRAPVKTGTLLKTTWWDKFYLSNWLYVRISMASCSERFLSAMVFWWETNCVFYSKRWRQKVFLETGEWRANKSNNIWLQLIHYLFSSW